MYLDINAFDMKTSNWFYSLCQFLLLIGVIPALGQEKHLIIVEKCLDKRAQFESITYELELKHKLFSHDDTIIRTAKVDLVRNTNDSLFGGYCAIVFDSIWYGYDGKNLMKVNPLEGTIEMVDAAAEPAYYIQSTWINNYVDYGFLKLSRGIMDYFNDGSIVVHSVDTIINELPCLGISFSLPDEQEIYDQTFFIAIDTIEFLLRDKMYSAFFQGNQQYTNWDFKQVLYGHETHIDKLEEANPANFKKVTQMESATISEDTIHFDFATLTGNVLSMDKAFRMTDVEAKFIVLDFWYTSCLPCIKGIPAVNQIHNSYKDKGVAVYGINPIDDAVKNKTRLDKFLQNNPMAYESVLVDAEVGGAVCRGGYPVFIILDRSYQVVYKESGFSENLYHDVSSFLDEALKK